MGGANGTLRLWDTEGQLLLGTDLPTPGDEIRSLAFAEDGGTICAAGPHVPLQRVPVDPDQAVRTICEPNRRRTDRSAVADLYL